MGSMASQITSPTIVYSAVYSGADQRKHQSSASLAFVRGIHRGPVNSPHKGPVTRKMFSFDDVIVSNDRYDSHGIFSHINITCNPDGKLCEALSDLNRLLLRFRWVVLSFMTGMVVRFWLLRSSTCPVARGNKSMYCHVSIVRRIQMMKSLTRSGAGA